VAAQLAASQGLSSMELVSYTINIVENDFSVLNSGKI
jgi:hypothetical protein